MVDTGGELNKLNGKMGISAPNNSVPVMKLIGEHNPRSHEELVKLIEEHVGGSDCCDVVSQGTVEEFGKNLYDAQDEFWSEKRYCLEDCIKWEYDLFIIQSLKGNTMEQMAISKLQRDLAHTELGFKESNEIIDNEYRIDIEVLRADEIIAGIQVKPTSYLKMRSEVKYRHHEANQKFDGEVFYLYYDYETEDFIKFPSIVQDLEEISG